MTSEPGHEPTGWENVPRSTTHATPAAQPVHYNSARHGNHVEESPELLRWRADLLMDEMMMGGVDVSAADVNRTFSGVDAPVVHRSQPPNNGPTYYQDQRDYGRSPRENGPSYDGAYPGSAERGTATNGEYGHNGRSNGTPISGSNASPGHGSIASESYSGEVERPTPPTPPTPRGAGIDGTYPSPASSDHFTGETARPEEPNTYPPHVPHSDLRSSSTGAYESYPSEPPRAPYPPNERQFPSSYEPKSYEVRPEQRGRETESIDYDRRIESNPRHDDASGSYSGERFSDRGITAPRRYPGTGGEAHPEPRYSETGLEHNIDSQMRYPTGQMQPQSLPREEETRPAPPREELPLTPDTSPGYMPPLRTTMDGVPAVGSGESTPRSDRLYSVEQQYEQFRREQSSHIQPVEPPRPAARPPLPPVEPPRQTVPPRVTPPVDQQTEWATGPNKWEYQDFSADPNAPEEDPLFGGYQAPERRYAQDSAVRHDPAQFVSAMSVMGSNKKRSTLLPRSTELDIDTLNREISDLHGEIAALLPVGNETSERARHLLDKAYSILQSDPSRSAEVEYYMQQVRTIVLRLHQSRQWSDLYRKRLHVYLLGWLGLSAMVLIARFLFQMDLEDALVWVTGVSWDSWLVAHWATFVGTAGAGAFGGALGALYTMQQHARGEYSFFDRKYGLRGLILPFMGLFVGALGYVIFGLIFALMGINPAESLTVAIVPTMAALAFGFSQESIYGTRD